MGSSLASAQVAGWENLNPFGQHNGGVRLYGINGSVGYQTDGTLLGLTGLERNRRSSPAFGAVGAAFGWSLPREDTSVTVLYSPSFANSFNLNGFRSFNQSLSVNAARHVGEKWSVSGSMQGMASDFGQMLFTPTPGLRLAATPTTFDDLVAALTRGPAANPQLAAMVGTAPVVGSPEAAYLFGARVLSVGVGASVGYQQSTRSGISVSLSAARTQFLNDNTSANPIADRESAQQMRATSGSGSLSWSYALTPRTSVGASLSSSRAFSRLQDGYTLHTALSVSRKMTQNLFMRASGGVGRYLPLTGLTPAGRFTQHEFGAGVGYKLYSHTLIASLDRSASDLYGLGADATLSGTGAWAWNRPGSSVYVTGSLGYSGMTGKRFQSVGSKTASISVGRALNSHTSVSVSYRYLSYPMQIFLASGFQNLSGVVGTVSWSPAERRGGLNSGGIHP